MAGDWIKMRMDLKAHPKVVRIASALKADRLRIIGGLYSAWCLFDNYSADGRMEGYTSEIFDEEIGLIGLADAMVSVGWLEQSPEGLVMPRFDAHNGQSAKRRAQDADRKREDRKIQNSSASEADKMRTREEKRREENKKTLSSDDDGANKADARPKAERIPYEQIFELYEKHCCVYPFNRPRILIRDDKRKALVKKVWGLSARTMTLEFWDEYFELATQNAHWMYGDKNKGGTWPGANFDFLLKTDRVKAIVEGNV